jgi:hypothetical protein
MDEFRIFFSILLLLISFKPAKISNKISQKSDHKKHTLIQFNNKLI